MCPCRSTLTAWTGSFPKEIQQKAAEEASSVTAPWDFYITIAKEGHKEGRKPGRFPQIPKDHQEAGTIIQRHPPLIEMSPFPPARALPLSIANGRRDLSPHNSHVLHLIQLDVCPPDCLLLGAGVLSVPFE